MIFNLCKRFEESRRNWHIASLEGGGGWLFSFKTPYPAVSAGCKVQVTPEHGKMVYFENSRQCAETKQ
jgi:hypothetical protein